MLACANTFGTGQNTSSCFSSTTRFFIHAAGVLRYGRCERSTAGRRRRARAEAAPRGVRADTCARACMRARACVCARQCAHASARACVFACVRVRPHLDLARDLGRLDLLYVLHLHLLRPDCLDLLLRVRKGGRLCVCARARISACVWVRMRVCVCVCVRVCECVCVCACVCV